MLLADPGNAESEIDRGIMHFDGANGLTAMTVSSFLVLGVVLLLIWWSIQAAYPSLV